MSTPGDSPADSLEASTSFTRYLEQALNHGADAAWLGANSPLAAPYFLGSLLTATPRANQPPGRGHVLQQILLLAAVSLNSASDPDFDIPSDTLKDLLRNGSREQRLVYWKFFHHPRPPVNFIIDQMNMAKATYHRDVKEKLPIILTQMAGVIVRLVRPTLRLEPPPARKLLGREALQATCMTSLERNEAIMLTGMAGVGKTALAAGIAVQWPAPVFWYSLRPALNDSIGSFLLMLGLFLHTHGASLLWLQMSADGDAIKPQVAVNLALADLATLPGPATLLCIDGVDILQASEIQRHTVLRAIIEALAEAHQRNAALLCTGQMVLLHHAVQVDVPTLALSAVDAYLQYNAVLLPRIDLGRVFEYTRGNPQALKMLTVLYHAGETLATIVERMPTYPAMREFINRLRQHLTPAEQRLIRILAVFRQPTPLHAWAQEAATIERLRQAQIIHVNEHGSVSLWSAFREVLYTLLMPAERTICHRIAATIRTQGGQYTAAAYHYVQGGRPDLGLQLWFPQREQEIRDGQAGAALALLRSITPAELSETDRQALALSIAELGKLSGETKEALEALQKASWPADQPLTIYARQLEGDLLVRQGHADQALDLYNRSLQALSGILERQQVNLHMRIGSITMNRFRNLDVAWKEAQLAHYTAELFQGEVLDERGSYAEARQHYQRALAVAEQLQDMLRQARVHFNLATIAARGEEIEAATLHFEQAMTLYQAIGDQVRVELTRTNMGAFFLATRRYHLAINAATQALAFFERIQFADWVALNAINLSESYIALEDYALAERYASQVVALELTAHMPNVLTILGTIRLRQQAFGEAQALLAEALETAQANTDLYIAAFAWRTMGEVHAATHDQPKARAAFAQSLELFSTLKLAPEAERTRVLLEALGNSASR